MTAETSEKHSTINGGLRYDQEKPRMDLVPPEAIFGLAEVYTTGAKKYAERNWELGMDWGRCFASLMRHAWKWMKGETFDEETGHHHMLHVAWNALALYVYYERKIGKDDRPRLTNTEVSASGGWVEETV